MEVEGRGDMSCAKKQKNQENKSGKQTLKKIVKFTKQKSQSI